VILLISFRNVPSDDAKSCLWNSCTFIAPAGLVAIACSAGDNAPCNVITSVSALITTVTADGATPVRSR